MTTRTSQTVFRFEAPFRLPGFDAVQPAGQYRVDYDEELLEAGSRLAWRRVGAFIHLPAIGANGATQQLVPVHPAALEAMQHKDQQP